MGVVLLEATYPGQTLEGARELVTVEDTKVGEAEGELSVGSGTVSKHEAVAWAVHWLEPKLCLFNLKVKPEMRQGG